MAQAGWNDENNKRMRARTLTKLISLEIYNEIVTEDEEDVGKLD